MKKTVAKYIALSTLAALAACSEDTTPFEAGQDVREIIITGEDFVEAYADSRTNVDINDKGASFSWSNTDTVGIFPDKGAQVFLIMQQNSGKTASFTGGGWALKESSTYGAYYPFIPDFAITRDAIPVDYTGQIQTGNASTLHLGKYDYMTAIATKPANGAVKMHFEHKGCLMHFKYPALPGASLSKVVMWSKDKVFPTKGKLNIDKGTIEVDPSSTVAEWTLTCKDVTVDEDSKQLTISYMMPPFNILDQKFNLKLVYNNGTEEHIELKGDNYEAGKSYMLTSEALQHEQVLIIEHRSNLFKIPTFEGVGIDGKVYWGDYTDQTFTAEAEHKYTDAKEGHTVIVGVKNATKVKFNSLEDIKSIDFTKMK